MADKEYRTSLTVDADDSGVARLRDTLQQCANLMQGIQAAGALAPGVSGGGGGGGGGHGGGGGSGGGGGGSGGSGVSGGGSGGGGGGHGSDGGGGSGVGGPHAPNFGGAAGFIRPDEGILTTAAGAMGNLLSFGMGGGPVASALVSNALRAGNLYLDYDRQASRTSGLFRGGIGHPGMAGAGAGLGFMAGETEHIFQQMAGAGLSGRDTSRLAGYGLQGERAGIGAGSIADFFSMGGAMGGGSGRTPDELKQTLGATLELAFKAGVQNSDLPKILNKVATATNAMAEKGVELNPDRILTLAAALTSMAGGGAPVSRGGRGIDMATNLIGIGQQVGGGGGTPQQQFMMLRAAGMGENGRDMFDAMDALEHGEVDIKSIIEDARTALPPGDIYARKAMARHLANTFGIGYRDALALLGGGDAGNFMLEAASGKGLARLGAWAGAGVGKFMAREANVERGTLGAGAGAAGMVLDAREFATGTVNKTVPKVVEVFDWMKALSAPPPPLSPYAAGAGPNGARLGAGMGGYARGARAAEDQLMEETNDGLGMLEMPHPPGWSPPSGAPMPSGNYRINGVQYINGVPQAPSQVPSPSTTPGGATIPQPSAPQGARLEIHLSPEAERFFAFFLTHGESTMGATG